MRRLSSSTLGAVTGASVPAYDRTAISPGVVHLGLGAFGRGHVARYCDDLLAIGDHTAAMVGASLRTGSTTTALAPQDGLYTLIESNGGEPHLSVIGAITHLAHGLPVIDHLAAPTTTAVTLTVTEKGYCIDPRTGGIDLSHPDIAHDLARPEAPRSAPGTLVAGLARRRQEIGTGLVVVSCDNLPANGAATRAAIVTLAGHHDEGLAAWIDEHVAFPSTVVDRIVPATTTAERDLVAERMGLRDDAPVRAEAHRLWVIEACEGLPPWRRVGAVVTDDIGPWQDHKLRLVNALHSAAAYLGLLAGHQTIATAVADPALHAALNALGADEIEPTLPSLSTTDGSPAASAGAATTEVLARFANPSLHHRCAQVAADGSEKLGPRILATAALRHRLGAPDDRLAAVVAAWVAHVERARREPTSLVDPRADRLLAVAGQARDRIGLVRELLGAIAAPEPLLGDDAFIGSVADALDHIREHGAAGTASAAP